MNLQASKVVNAISVYKFSNEIYSYAGLFLFFYETVFS